MGCKTFGYYFNENMAALGLPTLKTMGDNVTQIGTNVTAMLGALSHVGPKATVAELVGATLKAEKAMLLMALWGSYYLGACVGSMAVVSMRFQDCHPSAIPIGGTGRNNPRKYGQNVQRFSRAEMAQEVIMWGHLNNVYNDDLRPILMQHPEIYDETVRDRQFFVEAAKVR